MENFKLKNSDRMLAFIVLAILILSSLNFSYAETQQNLALPDISSVTDFESGSSYYINDAEGLTLLAQKVNSGDNMSGVKFLLNADLTLNSGTFGSDGNWSESGTPSEWIPIGNSQNPFSGIFDGGGHTISGLYCDSDSGFIGLFGNIVDGSVENLNIKDSYVSGVYYVGGIVGYASSLRNNCYIKNCTVKVFTNCYNNYVGAIAGCVISITDKVFEISGCTTESNSPITGVTDSGAVVSGSSEKIIEPEKENDSNLSWLWIVLILAVSFLVIVILLISMKKRGKEDKAAEPEDTAEIKAEETPAGEKPVEEAAAGEKPVEEAPAEEILTEEKPEGEVTENAEPSEPLTESKVESTPSDKINDQPFGGAAAVVIPTPETKPGVLGYYYIKQTTGGGYMFNLKAANHEIIATSEVYTTLAACKKGLQSIAKNASAAVVEDLTEASEDKFYAPKFELYADKSGEFRFRLKAANYEIIAVSQSYKTKGACRNGIDSVIRNSETRKIIVEDQETGERREHLRAEIVKAEKITAEEANNLLDDQTAEVLIETLDGDGEQSENPAGEVIYTDTLSEIFNNGDMVNLSVLIEKGLVPENTHYVKVVARGTLDKALTIEANQFSVDAVKMIVLTGGNAVKTND